MNTSTILEALRYYGDSCLPEQGQHDLRTMTAEVVSRFPEAVRDWLEDSGVIFLGGSGQLGEFIEICVPAREVKDRLVTVRIIYLAEKLMVEPRDEALHTIAHEIAHAYLAGQGDPDHQWSGGYDAEVKADEQVLAWGFVEPPDRANAREKYRTRPRGLREVRLGFEGMHSMNGLLDYLVGIGSGAVADPARLDKLLAACWDQFEGSEEGGMEGYKLLNRMEDVAWTPPILSFVVERHGGTMCGSARAELRHWEVNLDAQEATIIKTGHRQLETMAPRLSIKSMAAEIAQAILDDIDDERFVKQPNGEIKVCAAALFPAGSGFKRTVEGRRKRLCNYVGDILTSHGWNKSGWNRFRKDATRESEG